MRRKKKDKDENQMAIEDPTIGETVDGDGEPVIDEPSTGDETVADMEAESAQEDQMHEAPTVIDPPEDGPFAEQAFTEERVAVDDPTDEEFPEWDANVDPLPTIEELIRAGFSLKEAQEKMAELEEQLKIASFAGRPYFEVKCPLQRGFNKIGRFFSPTETVNVFLDELSPEDLATMKIANPLHLTVKCVGFELEDI